MPIPFPLQVFAGIFGYIADKELVDRRNLLAGAVVLWSLATAAAGLAQNLTQLVLLRSLVGVGEAAYSTIAPPMISDFFPLVDRNIAYGIYFLAIPVGGALGFAIGSVLGGHYGWRVAFLGVGLPGVFAAVSVLLVNNPVLGINDPKKPRQSSAGSECTITASPLIQSSNPVDEVTPDTSTSYSSTEEMLTSVGKGEMESYEQEDTSDWTRLWNDIGIIMKNKYFLCCLCGSTANNFALGGLADWFPAYMVRYTTATIAEAGIIVGAATVLGGIGGNLLGAKSCQYFEKKKLHNSYLIVSAAYTLPAAGFLLLLFNLSDDVAMAVTFLFLAEICVWLVSRCMCVLSYVRRYLIF